MPRFFDLASVTVSPRPTKNPDEHLGQPVHYDKYQPMRGTSLIRNPSLHQTTPSRTKRRWLSQYRDFHNQPTPNARACLRKSTLHQPDLISEVVYSDSPHRVKGLGTSIGGNSNEILILCVDFSRHAETCCFDTQLVLR